MIPPKGASSADLHSDRRRPERNWTRREYKGKKKPLNRLLIVTLARLVQLSNAAHPIELTLLGMVRAPRLVQFLNAELLMEVTLIGMATLARLVQSSNELSGIREIPFSMVMLVKPIHPLKAGLPMVFTVAGIV